MRTGRPRQPIALSEEERDQLTGILNSRSLPHGLVRRVRFVLGGAEVGFGKMTVSARSEELGDDEGDLDAAVEGPEAKIAFNGKYLTDVLGVLRETQVALETTGPSSPGVIRPVGADNYVHVVMPMFVQW